MCMFFAHRKIAFLFFGKLSQFDNRTGTAESDFITQIIFHLLHGLVTGAMTWDQPVQIPALHRFQCVFHTFLIRTNEVHAADDAGHFFNTGYFADVVDGIDDAGMASNPEE